MLATYILENTHKRHIKMYRSRQILSHFTGSCKPCYEALGY